MLHLAAISSGNLELVPELQVDEELSKYVFIGQKLLRRSVAGYVARVAPGFSPQDLTIVLSVLTSKEFLTRAAEEIGFRESPLYQNWPKSNVVSETSILRGCLFIHLFQLWYTGGDRALRSYVANQFGGDIQRLLPEDVYNRHFQTQLFDVAPFEERLGYEFQDKALVCRSLTPPQAVSRHIDSFEALECLGDAVVGEAVAAYFVNHSWISTLSVMTRVWKEMVTNSKLKSIAQRIRVHGSVPRRPNGDELVQPGDNQMADILEALFGAAYLDGGTEAAQLIAGRHLYPHISELMSGKDGAVRWVQ